VGDERNGEKNVLAAEKQVDTPNKSRRRRREVHRTIVAVGYAD
jgi:hypothetical protein